MYTFLDALPQRWRNLLPKNATGPEIVALRGAPATRALFRPLSAHHEKDNLETSMARHALRKAETTIFGQKGPFNFVFAEALLAACHRILRAPRWEYSLPIELAGSYRQQVLDAYGDLGAALDQIAREDATKERVTHFAQRENERTGPDREGTAQLLIGLYDANLLLQKQLGQGFSLGEVAGSPSPQQDSVLAWLSDNRDSGGHAVRVSFFDRLSGDDSAFSMRQGFYTTRREGFLMYTSNPSGNDVPEVRVNAGDFIVVSESKGRPAIVRSVDSFDIVPGASLRPDELLSVTDAMGLPTRLLVRQGSEKGVRVHPTTLVLDTGWAHD
jgi:hypothetical protein